MNKRNVRMLLAGPAVSFLALFALVVQQATPAFACNPSRTNNGTFYYDSYDATNLGTIGGVYSTNLVYTPYTCCSTVTDVYDKLYNTSSPGVIRALNEWTYDGSMVEDEMIFHSYSTNQTCGASVCLIQAFYSSQGQHNTYTVLWDNCSNNDGSAGYVKFQWNGSNITGYPNDCFDVDFTPNGASIAGTMGTLADQMPGGSSNKETMNSANEYSNGAWHSFYNNAVHSDNGQYGSGQDYFGWDANSTLNADIYDNSCAS